MDLVFLYRLVQSDVLDLDKGNVFSVVRPVSYRPGAGYFWKYLVPKKLLPLLLLPRPPVPKTGNGIVPAASLAVGLVLGCARGFVLAVCFTTLLPSQDFESYRRAVERPVANGARRLAYWGSP